MCLAQLRVDMAIPRQQERFRMVVHGRARRSLAGQMQQVRGFSPPTASVLAGANDCSWSCGLAGVFVAVRLLMPGESLTCRLL